MVGVGLVSVVHGARVLYARLCMPIMPFLPTLLVETRFVHCHAWYHWYVRIRTNLCHMELLLHESRHERRHESRHESSRARARARARTHAHMHAHTRTRTHTRTHARTHARTHRRTHARTDARTHPRARTHARTHTRTDTRKHTRSGAAVSLGLQRRCLSRCVLPDSWARHCPRIGFWPCPDECAKGWASGFQCCESRAYPGSLLAS
jgi:hypothetical protein